MQIKGIRIKAGEALDLIFIQISYSNFETLTAMTLKLQEVANFGMFFHSHFIHVCVQ